MKKIFFLLLLISCNKTDSGSEQFTPTDSLTKQAHSVVQKTTTQQASSDQESDSLSESSTNPNDRRSEMSFNSTSPQGSSDDSFVTPIDYYLSNCLDTNSTTVGMIDCYNTAIHKVDTVINSVYHKIFNKLDAEDKIAFKTSHDHWLQYFKAEKKFLHQSFYTWANYQKYGHGREHSITQIQWVFQIARSRYIALCNYDEQLYSEEE